MRKDNVPIILEESNISVNFHPQCEYGIVDDELIERLEDIINGLVLNSKKYYIGYINSSSAEIYLKQFERLKAFTVNEIVIVFQTPLIEDASEVEAILLNDYKGDSNNTNSRNLPKRIVDGGNDDYLIFVALS